MEYNVIAKGLLMFEDNYQWVIALTLPVFREFNVWFMTLLATKASNGDPKTVEITCVHIMGTRHALFLSYTLGSIATSETSFIILATDFLINLYISLRFVWVKKRTPLNIEKQMELLQDLMINEMVEFTVPLVYFLCFCSAYYGPNADLIGNIGNSYWQYNAVKDVGKTIENISMFFFIDFGSLVISGALLWTLTRVSLYRAFCFYQKEYGVVFLINLTCILYFVSNYRF